MNTVVFFLDIPLLQFSCKFSDNERSLTYIDGRCCHFHQFNLRKIPSGRCKNQWRKDRWEKNVIFIFFINILFAFSIINKICIIIHWIVDIDALHQGGYRNLPLGLGLATYFTDCEIGDIPNLGLTEEKLSLVKTYVKTKLKCLKRNQKKIQSLVSHNTRKIQEIQYGNRYGKR